MSSLSREFRNRCEGIALRERQELGLKSFDPLSGESLAAKYHIRIVTPDELQTLPGHMREAFLQQQKIWGFLLQLPDCPPLILIHPHQPPTRRQSTLMHELAHFLLGHQGDDLAIVLTGRERNALQEEEGRYLGACLQIPERSLKWASQVGLSRTRAMSHFNASESMVQFRCNMTGIHL